MKKVTARYLIIQEGLALVFLLAFCSVSPSWAIAPGEDLGSIYHPTNLDYIGEARVSDGTTVVLGVPDQSAVGGLIMHPQSLTGLIDVTNSSAIIRHDSASVNLGSGAGSSLVILPGGKLFVGAPLTTSSTFSGTNPHGRIRIASMNAVNYFNDNTGYEYDLSSNPLSPLPNGNNAGTYAGVGSYLTNWNIDLSQSLGAGFGDAAVAFGQPNGKQYLAVSAPRARPVLTYQYLCEGVSYPNYQRYCDDKDTGVVIIFEYIPASQRFVPIQTFWNPGDEFLSGEGELDLMGFSLAVSDVDNNGKKDILVGAPFGDGAAADPIDSGRVYILKDAGYPSAVTDWSKAPYGPDTLDPAQLVTGGQYGIEIAADASVITVGAPGFGWQITQTAGTPGPCDLAPTVPVNNEQGGAVVFEVTSAGVNLYNRFATCPCDDPNPAICPNPTFANPDPIANGYAGRIGYGLPNSRAGDSVALQHKAVGTVDLIIGVTQTGSTYNPASGLNTPFPSIGEVKSVQLYPKQNDYADRVTYHTVTDTYDNSSTYNGVSVVGQRVYGDTDVDHDGFPDIAFTVRGLNNGVDFAKDSGKSGKYSSLPPYDLGTGSDCWGVSTQSPEPGVTVRIAESDGPNKRFRKGNSVAVKFDCMWDPVVGGQASNPCLPSSGQQPATLRLFSGMPNAFTPFQQCAIDSDLQKTGSFEVQRFSLRDPVTGAAVDSMELNLTNSLRAGISTWQGMIGVLNLPNGKRVLTNHMGYTIGDF